MLRPGLLRKSSISEQERFEALGNRRRRFVLLVLFSEFPNPVSLTELVDRLAEHEQTPESDPEAVRDGAYAALYQVHCPRLEELDLVTISETDQEVRLTDEGIRLWPYLWGRPAQLPWAICFFAVSVIGAGLVSLAAIGEGSVVDVSSLVVVLVLVIGFGVLSGVYLLWSWRSYRVEFPEGVSE